MVVFGKEDITRQKSKLGLYNKVKINKSHSDYYRYNNADLHFTTLLKLLFCHV